MKDSELERLWLEDIRTLQPTIQQTSENASLQIFLEDTQWMLRLVRKWAPMLEGMRNDDAIKLTAYLLENTVDMVNTAGEGFGLDDNERRRFRQFYVPIVRRIMDEFDEDPLQLTEVIGTERNVIAQGNMYRWTYPENGFNMDFEEEKMDEFGGMMYPILKRRGTFCRTLFRLDDDLQLWC
jgi:hypothetical protein